MVRNSTGSFLPGGVNRRSRNRSGRGERGGRGSSASGRWTLIDRGGGASGRGREGTGTGTGTGTEEDRAGNAATEEEVSLKIIVEF